MSRRELASPSRLSKINAHRHALRVREGGVHDRVAPQHALRRLLLGMVALLISCIGAATMLLVLRPAPITSYEDQVADALRQRNIGYQEIQLGERWPDHINFQYGSNVFPYSYQIKLQLKNGQQTDGWLTCAKLEQSCTLSISQLDLHEIPVRDFSQQQQLPVVDWLLASLKQVLP